MPIHPGDRPWTARRRHARKPRWRPSGTGSPTACSAPWTGCHRFAVSRQLGGSRPPWSRPYDRLEAEGDVRAVEARGSTSPAPICPMARGDGAAQRNVDPFWVSDNSTPMPRSWKPGCGWLPAGLDAERSASARIAGARPCRRRCCRTMPDARFAGLARPCCRLADKASRQRRTRSC